MPVGAGVQEPQRTPGRATRAVQHDHQSLALVRGRYHSPTRCPTTWHPWTSLVDDPHRPTYALIDLDPGATTTWDELLVLARLHRTALHHLRITARPKTTGRGGIHIWVPITAEYGFDETRAWVQRLSIPPDPALRPADPGGDVGAVHGRVAVVPVRHGRRRIGRHHVVPVVVVAAVVVGVTGRVGIGAVPSSPGEAFARRRSGNVGPGPGAVVTRSCAAP